MRAFCLVCVFFKNEHWCLGYCQQKNIYIHKPLRNCTKYNQANVIDDPFYILRWYKKASDIAKLKYDYVKTFFEQKKILEDILEGQPEEEEKEE